jgi:hypothetical protein
VDLTKDFFFSYTYPIMRNLQTNMKSMDGNSVPHDDMFVWNAFLTRGIRQSLKSTRWIVALVHGFFQQVRSTLCSHDLTTFQYTTTIYTLGTS